MTDVPQQPPQQPPQWGTPPPHPGPPPGWGQGQPAYAGGGGGGVSGSPGDLFQKTSPRVLMGLALIVAGFLVVLAVLVSIVVTDADDVVDKLANAFGGISLPIVLLVPLALLLLRGTGDDAPPATGLGRAGVLAAAVLAAIFAVFCLLGLLVDLVADFGGFRDGGDKVTSFFVDLARLLAALAATWWAFREFQRAGGIPAGMPGGPSAPTTAMPPPPAPPPPGGWQQPGPPPAPPIT